MGETRAFRSCRAGATLIFTASYTNMDHMPWRRKKALPAWPDPMDSMGDKVTTRTKGIREHTVWFSRGPALERYNEIIRPEVEGILNNIELPEGEKLIVKLYMVGPTEQRVNPMIMICCPNKATCEKAEALIRQSELLERQESHGFGLGSSAFPFEASFVPRPLGKGIYLDLHPSTEDDLKVDVYGLNEPGIGRKLGFVNSSQSGWSVQYATGGPVVRLGDNLYQLTVAHATKPIPDSKAPQQQGWDADECEFDGQSEEDEDEHLILSRGSLSPGGFMRDAEPDPDQQWSQQSSAYTDSYPATPDSRLFGSERMTTPTMSPKSVQTPEEHDEWKSSTPLGSFPVPDGYGGELDYLLIKLPAETFELAKELNEVTLDKPSMSRSVQVRDIASVKNDSVSILAITSREVIPGSVLRDSVSFKTRRSCSFQQLLTVLLSKGLREGDSGSAIIDAQTGHFYGYVVLGVDGDSVAYALPSPMVMAKITTQFQQLPTFYHAHESGRSNSPPMSRYQHTESRARNVRPMPLYSALPSISEDSGQSGDFMVPLGDHISLQGQLAEARGEVERLNNELRDRHSELEGDRQIALLDPTLVGDMRTATLDPRFQNELNSLERWFYVVSAGQQGVALHTLLQNANPAYVDYLSHVFRRRGSIAPLSELIGTIQPAGSNTGEHFIRKLATMTTDN